MPFVDFLKIAWAIIHAHSKGIKSLSFAPPPSPPGFLPGRQMVTNISCFLPELFIPPLFTKTNVYLNYFSHLIHTALHLAFMFNKTS